MPEKPHVFRDGSPPAVDLVGKVTHPAWWVRIGEKNFGPYYTRSEAEEVAEMLVEYSPDRACRECGCTEDDCSQCIERTGMACYWVEPNLCSACAGETP